EPLGTLLRKEIVVERRRYPQFECSFKHGLLQEAALASLTPARRRELYGAIAGAVEELYRASLDDQLENLAFYYYRSDDKDAALRYLERAAEPPETAEP